MTQSPILRVAVAVPLSRLFDYLPPAGGDLPQPGCRVQVRFGRRPLTGLVMAVSDKSELPAARLKRAEALLDREPLLSADDLWLISFTSDYYHHPIGEVAAAALPALLRQGRPVDAVVEHVAASALGRRTDLDALARRAPKQAALLARLRDAAGGVSADTLNAELEHWRRALKPLEDKGLAERFDAAAEQAPPTGAEPLPGPTLNADQQAAVAAIAGNSGFGAFLLDGVTGSGKTEVYLQLMSKVLDAGRQVLVLVPEIGLTPQLVTRLRDRLGITPVLLHSALTDSERLANWRAARDASARLIIGTRSAVFAPLPKLGFIVVDEEHDHSFKQQEGLRYSARDLAIARAKRADVPVVLGTATPTLELIQHCNAGNYTRLPLPRRAGGATPPAMRVVDVSRQAVADGLSDALVRAIEAHVGAGNQALLFLNRRGFAPTLICGGCGHVAECRRCDARMTLHANDRRLRCHHCGAERPADETCGDCGNPLRPLGAGTERLEDALARRFPNYRITRIDSDSTQKRGAMDAALEAATQGEPDILVGTQMLSKGHHFPKLTLVGIVNADQGLFGTDFRADERLAQSIVQVAGRAGREQQRGEVLIQTAFPAHPFWTLLIDKGYRGVVDRALEERQSAGWPPFSRLALLRASAHRRGDAQRFLELARDEALALAADSVRILGPVDAVMARRAGRYRAQLLVQSSDRRALHRLLADLRPRLEDAPAARRVRWSVDVDPVELL